MATVTESPARVTPGSSRFLLHDVSWSTYEALLRDQNGSRVRLTYDRGELEFMTTSPRHEMITEWIARLIGALTEELNIPIRSLGSATFRREARSRGLEPDKCYYITHEGEIRGKDEIDLSVDPPPDLAVEVEVTRSALDRMGVYAGLGVPEVWRFDGQTLHVHVLQPDGRYAEAARSRLLPGLPPEEVTRFLREAETSDETAWVRSFRAWVRDVVLPEARHADPPA